MHSENSTAASFWEREIGGRGWPALNAFMHTFSAAWNAGAWIFIVGGIEMPRIEMPDVAAPPGSGKLDTPCARMHLATVSPAPLLALFDVPAALTPTPAPPHAANINAHAATAGRKANGDVPRWRQGT